MMHKATVFILLLWFVSGVAITAPVAMPAPESASESAPESASETEQSLADVLKGLIAKPDAEAILEVVGRNKAVLLTRPDYASLAVIALRRGGHAEVALALAGRVRIEYGADRRLDFERAVTHWTLGNCARAAPLLRRLLDDSAGADGADDLVSRESRLFLASCEAMQAWRPEFSISVDYDPNLGNTAPRRAINVEPGSRYDTLLKALSALVDLPEVITLGEEPVAGIWFGVHPGFIRHRHHEDGVDAYRFGLDARRANRAGFEQAQVRINYNRWRKKGRFSTLTRLEARHGKAQTGRGRPHRINSSLGSQLRYGFEIRPDFEIAAGLGGHYSESLSHRDSRLQGLDQRVTLRHSGDSVRLGDGQRGDESMLARLGWSVYLEKGVDDAKPQYYSGKRNTLGVEIGPILVPMFTPVFGSGRGSGRAPGLADTPGHATFEVSHGRKRYDTARPWLRTPHEDETLNIGMTYTYPFGKERAVVFKLTHRQVTSPDPFDSDENWHFSMVFKY